MADFQLVLLKTKQFAYTEVCNSSGGGRGAGGPALTACICTAVGADCCRLQYKFVIVSEIHTWLALLVKISSSEFSGTLEENVNSGAIGYHVSCSFTMSAIQHVHFYVNYKLNCKIFCIYVKHLQPNSNFAR